MSNIRINPISTLIWANSSSFGRSGRRGNKNNKKRSHRGKTFQDTLRKYRKARLKRQKASQFLHETNDSFAMPKNGYSYKHRKR